MEKKKTFLAIWDGEVVGTRTSRHYRYAVIIGKRGDFTPTVGGFTRTHDSAAKLSKAFGPHHTVLGIVELQMIEGALPYPPLSCQSITSKTGDRGK